MVILRLHFFLALAAATSFAQKLQIEPTPIVQWTFDHPGPGSPSGKAKVKSDALIPPEYPTFPAENKSLTLPGFPSSWRIPEPALADPNSLRFTNGDTITIETWVALESINTGSFAYLISKGRNQNKAFTPNNQNWALRLKGHDGIALPSFLFRTAGPESQFHRWTAIKGFEIDGNWHHLALSYTFGKPDSIVAYLDGSLATQGHWDLGGRTTRPPISDADDIMIGNGNGNSSGNQLKGALDQIAIYRDLVPENFLLSRYQHLAPPPIIDPDIIPSDTVLVEICEKGVPGSKSWPKRNSIASEVFTRPHFAILSLPFRYVATGVRGDRKLPFLLRATSKITLPPGTHRFILRGRNSARLLIDGKKMIQTGFTPPAEGALGFTKDQDDFLNPGDPNFRFITPGNEEALTTFTTSGGQHLISMQQLVGTSGNRPEPGEFIVALSLAGTSQWQILTPSDHPIPYTDQSFAPLEKEHQRWIKQTNFERRTTAYKKHAPYWERRRQIAQSYLDSLPPHKHPLTTSGLPANNQIDHYLNTKIQDISSQIQNHKPGQVHFYKQVFPILEAKCFSCHRGEKTKGNLDLSTLISALVGGEFDGPAITAKHPEESSLFTRITTQDDDERMPPKGDPVTSDEQILIKQWIIEGAHWPELNVDHLHLTELTDDLTFLRRISLDTIGVPPSLSEIQNFLAEDSPNRRAKEIDRLLADPRWADNWMGYWQDLLAENPNILNPTLNNTGPFRWWLHESLLDDKPLDLVVTELIRMEGSQKLGGPAGFGLASQNDVPMAAKGLVISSAFLGVEMKCARCHDAPSHSSLQKDLFGLAALLSRKSIAVPETSSVSLENLRKGGRTPLIQVTLKPGTRVAPAWPFHQLIKPEVGARLAEHPSDSRDLLAALITAPQNERFAQVMANRLWQQLMGRGLVAAPEDWEKSPPSHPQLLRWLGHELVRSNYSLKHLARLILNSHAYQRITDHSLKETSPLFTSPAPRRLRAEQIVDSLFHATGKPFRTEEMNIDIDGRRPLASSISLGQPRRAWMLGSLSNERDRLSLTLPRVQAISDVLTAFGWTASRQSSTSSRSTDPTTLQPAILSNGTMGIWLTRLSDDHALTNFALKDQSLDHFLEQLFLRLLTRKPTPEEKALYRSHLAPGYQTRITNAKAVPPIKKTRPPRYVSWYNHLDPVADELRRKEIIAARTGEPPTNRLNPDWRERFEDLIWSIINSPEWIYTP